MSTIADILSQDSPELAAGFAVVDQLVEFEARFLAQHVSTAGLAYLYRAEAEKAGDLHSLVVIARADQMASGPWHGPLPRPRFRLIRGRAS